MNARTLKYIATASMLVDHAAVALYTLLLFSLAGSPPPPAAPLWYEVMRVIGRLAFPLFAFLVAEGCAHTRSLPRYLARLAGFAALSQIPYLLFHNVRLGADHLLRWAGGNVLFTLLCGACAVYCYRRLWDSAHRGRWMLGMIAAFVAVLLLQSEYDLCGVLIILLCYALRPKESGAADAAVHGSRWVQALACGGVTLLYYMLVMSATWPQTLVATLAAGCVALYNGRAGRIRGKFAFYIFYPAHQLILAAALYIYMWL